MADGAVSGMRGKRAKHQDRQPAERVRYEVYGMPIEGIIEGAMAPEREAAEAEERARAEEQERAKAEKQAEQPAWPDLEDLKAKGPRARPRKRR